MSTQSMSTLPKFDPPAQIDDFQGNPKRDQFLSLWSAHVNEMTEQSIAGDPNDPLDQNRDFYVNPLKTDMSGAISPPAVIRWTAFPNRLILAYPFASDEERAKYADDGPPDKTYQPIGPRGWQDEYCELSVTRNAQGKITKIDYTAENSQYWEAMWLIDEAVVLKLYQELVGPQVKLEDLYERDRHGKVVIDKQTGKPAYDGTNQWNRDSSHGAVHLVSAPNNLFAEIYLAAAATILRSQGGAPVIDKSKLITCSRYGTPNRNSDPTIGFDVNQIIRSGGKKVTLENPVGLYLQTPNFQTYELPANAPSGAHAADYWTIVRGSAKSGVNEPDRILHATYEVPEGHGFSVGDIKIAGNPIEYGSQLMRTFEVALAGVAVPTADPAQTPRQCIPSPAPAKALAAGLEDCGDLAPMLKSLAAKSQGYQR